MMDLPAGYYFTEEHEWVKDEGDGVVSVGITHFAQDALGDIVYVEFPDVGEDVSAGAEFGVVESVKAVSDIYSPVSGEVVEINEELDDAPEAINENAYDAWIIKIKMSDASELDGLFDEEAYREFLESEG